MNNPKVYCHYVSCKNEKCEKHYPKHLAGQTVQNVVMGGHSPLFCIWQKTVNGIVMNYKPECYEK